MKSGKTKKVDGKKANKKTVLKQIRTVDMKNALIYFNEKVVTGPVPSN
jgi:hypothetical protein